MVDYCYAFASAFTFIIITIAVTLKVLISPYFNLYAPGDDSPHGGISLLLCPYVRMSEFG